MSKRMNTARTGAALTGIAAIVAASVLPASMATAEETGDVNSVVTRAVLATGNANGEINRATLVTQINLDGNGTADFTVPVVDGGTPKNMDSFGSPEVVDGSAQYNMTVDGPQTFRTSQDYNPDELPVTVEVSATLDGAPIAPVDLAGQTGLAKLTYTITNNTSEPTQLTYKDARGETITEETEVAVPMGASLVFMFPPSWQEISSPKAQAVTGNGTGDTQVQGSVPLLPDALPGQSTTGTFEIEGRVTDAVVPPADIKVALLNPAEFPDLAAKVEEVEGLADQAATLTDAGDQLKAGGIQASEGADQLNDAVAGQLGPGVQELSDGLNMFNDVAISTLRSSAADLPTSVTSSPDFAQITGGFDALRSATDGLREKLGQWTPAVKTSSSQKPGPYLKSNGMVDTGDRATVARVLWALSYGGRSQDVPNDSPTKNFAESNGGLTNPNCDPKHPENVNNPCGAFQVLDLISTTIEKSLVPGLEGLLVTLPTTISDGLTGDGASAIKGLASALGCDFNSTGYKNGPLVDPVTGFAGNPCGETITVNGNANCPNPFQDQLPIAELPCNLIVNAILGGVDFMGVEQSGLTQSIFNPLKLDGTQPDPSSGIASILGTFYPTAWNAKLKPGIEEAIDGMRKLNGVITTRADGYPDKDTSKKNTATGIIMQTRASLAQGGIGGDGYPAGRCAGYNTPGVPSSGLNADADANEVEATCAAGDVMQIAVYGVDALEEGVSVTLLESISEELLAGVGTYSPGCDATASLACAAGSLAAGGNLINEGVNLKPGENLVYGIGALAEGLKAIPEAGEQLGETANDGSKQAGQALAIFEAMQSRADSGAAIPGGAPEGVDQINGVYAFAFDGAGGTATENAARAGLGFLGLIAAGGVGALLANRAGG